MTRPAGTGSGERTAASLGQRLRQDVTRVASCALVGGAAFAIVEYALTILAQKGSEIGALIRLVPLTATLALIFVGLTSVLFIGVSVVARLLLLATGKGRARSWAGLFAKPGASTEARSSAGVVWGVAIGIALFAAGSTMLTLKVSPMFKEAQLTALVLSALQLGLGAVVFAIGFVVFVGVRALGRRVHGKFGRWRWLNPFGHPTAAMATLVLLAMPAVWILLRMMPQLEPLVPYRHILALLAFSAGVHGGSHLLARRGSLFPSARRPRRVAMAVSGMAALVIVPLTLVKFGADPATKSLAITASPPLSTLIAFVRKANDFDGDGFGSLLGELDCGPFDPNIRPGVRDIPDNGIDENCDGRDFKLGALPTYRSGERMAVPEAYLSNWNFLLITVDTLRYDHTGFGGYIKKTQRNTTPNLDKLVSRSVSFTFASAPSAGTMASIPAILTSRFFHSGIALDENVKPGMPPRLTGVNVLLSEILKRRGYYNGAILTHEYFNDWGMEQGFDHFDNELGAKHNPDNITSAAVTDKALAFMGKHSTKKWFLWLHYLDPHGHYVDHPGEVAFGNTEEDKYDGEIAFTDKHLGRLFDELPRIAGGDRTVIIITSDHGDAFKEHGFINHGQALYNELLHVPLIVYIPNIEPRDVPGAVSPLDIVPTIADLAGIDISDLTLEGESLVPQLFYKRDAHDRVVFSETNWPRPLRAAITSRYKLISNLKANVYELYDLKKDWAEKNNIWTRDRKGFDMMKGYLDDWLERVYYSRDGVSNQAMNKLKDYILPGPPTPKVKVKGVTFDNGKIEVIGFGGNKGAYKAGETAEIDIYFRVVDRPSGSFKLQVEMWLADDPKMASGKSRMRLTAGGTLPTNRWRKGEYIADKFKLRLPSTWQGHGPSNLHVGLRFHTAKNRPMTPSAGPRKPGDDNTALLGGSQLLASPAAKGKRSKGTPKKPATLLGPKVQFQPLSGGRGRKPVPDP